VSWSREYVFKYQIKASGSADAKVLIIKYIIYPEITIK
jgi:hypothetical protein